MELSWSTFVLEIINFLVLVWIMKRFLYKPVMDVIAQRKAGIEKVKADAQTLHADAEKLQQQYENRLADWSEERQRAREALHRELEAERAAKIEECRTEIEQEREKARVVEDRRQAEALQAVQETALSQGAKFATRLLEAAAGADTQAGLVELVIDGLSQLPDQRLAEIRRSYQHTNGEILVQSAFPLTDDQRRRLEQALLTLIGSSVPLRFELNAELLAGLHIAVGAWILGCNLRDELDGMTALVHAE